MRSAGLAAAAALTFALAPAAAAQLPAKQGGALSPLLERLAAPALSSDSQARQARALGIARNGPGSLVRRGGRVLVEVGFDHGAIARRGDLREAGGRVLSASRPYQSATVAVLPADLGGIASVPGVESVQAVRAPIVRAVECDGGSVISEGLAQMNVTQAVREATKGAGVTVGVLSDSFDTATKAADGGEIATKAATDVSTGDLPGAPECGGPATEVQVVGSDFKSGQVADEGRAMLQIVHDIAPEAKLEFATAFEGEELFAKNIEALWEAGAEVIVDDVAYLEEPFFQEGPVANAIRKVTEGGATYLSAAGNDNLFDGEGNEFASWEAPKYRDAGRCPAAIAALAEFNSTHCLDFNPGSPSDTTFGIRVQAGETLTVDLQWSEPWGGVGTDLDAFLLDAEGRLLTRSIADNVGSTQQPSEIVQWENRSSSDRVVQLVVNRFSGGSPRLKLALLQNGRGVSGTEYPASGGGDVVGPTIFGHAGSADAIAVGAVEYAVDPLSPDAAPEEYSSRGPSTLYFEPVQSGGPAAALASPEVLSKPDVAATDCGRTTFFAHVYAEEGPWRFCGTSAAAPHAAGVIALMKAVEPLAGPGELREALLGTATPFPGYGTCAMGAGFVEASGALEALGGGSIVAPQACEVPNALGPVSRAGGDWGSEATPSNQENPQPPSPTRPGTFFARHPAKTVRAPRAVRLRFRFVSDQSPVTYLCSVDARPFRACQARLSRRFGFGSHVVRAEARNSAGLTDPTPAVFRFRVKRVG